MSNVTTTVARVLEEDTPCSRCGYNLRGLATTGLCPECGTAIAHAISGNLLKNADPKWLERLRIGISLKIWSIVLGIALLVVVDSGVPYNFVREFVARKIVVIAGGALVLWATFLIMSQEPRIALHEDPITLRKALRVCPIVAFGGAALSIANNSFITSMAVPFLVVMFVAWSDMLYFRRFAERIPDPKLAKSTTLLMWSAPIAGGLIFVLGLVILSGVFYKRRGEMAGLELMGLCFCVWMFGSFLLLVWYIRLLTKYRKAFKMAASQSRASVRPQPIA